MRFEIYQEAIGLASVGLLSASTAGQWRWRLRGDNQKVIASGESYHNKQDCLDAIDLVQGTTTTTPVIETKD